MAEPVEWAPDGTPRSPRFGDVYRSRGGGLEQARHVFLAGCGLPGAWAGQRQWRVLETGFGLGLNFLAAWHAWRQDPHRPALLHFVSVEAFPVSAGDIVRSAQADEAIAPLARELAGQWWGLVPGVHRLSFDDGRVLLTLCIGEAREMLAELDFAADSVFLDGFDPARNPRMWDLPLLQALARCCRRGTTLATWTVAVAVRHDLQQCGFRMEKIPGLPPKRESLRAVFDPAGDWPERAPRPAARQAVVIGGGISGAAAAASLARRGVAVRVLDAAAQPASGASGLPAGLLAPHTSADDNLLSRLSRAGVRLTLREAALRLEAARDWAPTGAIEVRPQPRALPALGEEQLPWQAVADHEGRPAVRHEAAAWIQPAALVRAWLAQPGVTWQGGARVARVERDAGRWRVLGDSGEVLAEADLVVIAAALGSAGLAPLWLHPVRGQVSWALLDGPPAAAQPLNGNGHFLPDVPLPAGRAWLTGSTYGRGDTSLDEREADHAANLERLRALDAAIAGRLAPAFTSGAVKAWTGVRCASSDRRPLVGELDEDLWVSTAMGSRGLTFALLCAELLAARRFGEPLPLPRRLAAALDVARVQKP